MIPSPYGRWVESRFLIALSSIKSSMFIQWGDREILGNTSQTYPVSTQKLWEDLSGAFLPCLAAGSLFRTARHWSMKMLDTARRSNAVHAVIQSSSDLLREKKHSNDSSHELERQSNNPTIVTFICLNLRLQGHSSNEILPWTIAQKIGNHRNLTIPGKRQGWKKTMKS